MKLLIHLLWIFLPCNPLVTARVKAMFPSTSVVTSNNHRSYINRSNNDPLWNSRPWKGLLIWVCCLQVLTSLGQTQWCACSHPALLCAVYPLQNQINVAAENELFLAWRSSDREGVRGFLCPPGCHAVKADVWWSHSDCRCLLVLPAGRDELWLGVRAVFFPISLCTMVLWGIGIRPHVHVESLGLQGMWKYSFPLPLHFSFPNTKACRPAELCPFFSAGESSFIFLYGNLIVLITCQE